MLWCISIIAALFMSSQAFAECDFKTGEHIAELQDPSNIKLIEINTPKSAKFAKNFIRIATSKSKNIPRKLKKRFDANVIIHYSFGKCAFKGKVRQNGDWKDHIDFLDGGKAVRSLDVKLQTGNVMSAVQFKLLIPKTRNGENEILASLILKHLGIISPDTFAVNSSVNATSSIMLFQENARKELVEKNYRRESAIFEGDEELLWSFKNFYNFELEPLALARLLNGNWFEKGSSSQIITLSSFSRLQSSYINYTNNIDHNLWLLIHPNQRRTSDFSDYMFVLLAMNGGHALRPHNRKYYFNAITMSFEPIYYDGDVVFSAIKSGSSLDDVLSKQFTSNINPQFISKILTVTNSKKLKDDFIKRANKLDINVGEFFGNSISQFNSNVEALADRVSASVKKRLDDELLDLSTRKYLERLNKSKFSQSVISKLERTPTGYHAVFETGAEENLSIKEVAKVLAKNALNGERTIFLGEYKRPDDRQKLFNAAINFGGDIITAPGIRVSLSPSTKVIIFHQSKQDDWVLIKSAELRDWTFKFIGIKKSSHSNLMTDQRFNEFGLTGCLTFYDSVLENTSIEIVGGVCEDSLNLVSSNGHLDTVSIDGAHADAIDIDFSSLTLNKVIIQNAGNDCLDVSGGDYRVNSLKLQNCGDKGVSVGEASTFFASDMELSSANIGISAKDLSRAEVSRAKVTKINVCIEVMQKKQEFGGASLKVGELECEGVYEVDNNSAYREEML